MMRREVHSGVPNWTMVSTRPFNSSTGCGGFALVLAVYSAMSSPVSDLRSNGQHETLDRNLQKRSKYALEDGQA